MTKDTSRAEVIRPVELAARLGITTAGVWSLVNAGELPQPRRLGRRIAYWTAPDLAHLGLNFERGEAA